jgi:hypothetical protein
MSNINSLLNSVPKLGAEKSDGTSTSYHDWKFAMSMVLRRADCWEIMTKQKPTTRDGIKEWEKKAEETLTAIGLTIDPSQYQYISDAVDGVDAWMKLKKVYEKNSRSNRIALMRQFYNAKHDPRKPIHDYITQITKVAAQLKAIGAKLEDITVIDVLIMNLDGSWSNIAASLSASMDELNVVSDVTGALIDEEGRRNAVIDPESGTAGQAMLARTSGKEKKFHTKITCYRCEKQGHTARNCREDLPKEKNDSAEFAVDNWSF